jgi:hypothetical protein
MPALQVFVDGKAVATVVPQPHGIMSVSVHGARTEDPFAHLDVSGGNYPDGEGSTYLTWIDNLPLHPGQSVSVSFVESGEQSHGGRTIEELYPDEPKDAQETPFKSIPEVIDDLRMKPCLHKRYAFRLVTSGGTEYIGEAPDDAHSFTFSVVWNWVRPERVSLSLHTYSLDALAIRGPVNDLVREYLAFGGSAHLELVA